MISSPCIAPAAGDIACKYPRANPQLGQIHGLTKTSGRWAFPPAGAIAPSPGRAASDPLSAANAGITLANEKAETKPWPSEMPIGLSSRIACVSRRGIGHLHDQLASVLAAEQHAECSGRVVQTIQDMQALT
jgi:hypothetical protein